MIHQQQNWDYSSTEDAFFFSSLVASDILHIYIRNGILVKWLQRQYKRYQRKGRKQNGETNDGQINDGHANDGDVNIRKEENYKTAKCIERNHQFANTLCFRTMGCLTGNAKGLRNYGQTCFLNSVLQSLASLTPFIAYLERIVELIQEQRNYKDRQSVNVSANTGLSFLLPMRNQNINSCGSLYSSTLSQKLLNIFHYVNASSSLSDSNKNNSDKARKLRNSQNKANMLDHDPRDILKIVATKHSQFYSQYATGVNNQQQDAQELLQALIGLVINESQHGHYDDKTVSDRYSHDGKKNSHPLRLDPYLFRFKDDVWDSKIDNEEMIPEIISSIYQSITISDSFCTVSTDELSGTNTTPYNRNIETGNIHTLSSMLYRMHSEQERLKRVGVQSSHEDHDAHKTYLVCKRNNQGDDEPVASSENSNKCVIIDCNNKANEILAAEKMHLEEEDRNSIHLKPCSKASGNDLQICAKENRQAESLPELPMSMKIMLAISPIAPSPFSGWIGTTIVCCACNHIRPIQNTPFLELPVVPSSISHYYQHLSSIDKINHRSPSFCSLDQCLMEFASVERVKDVECWACPIQKEINQVQDEIVILKGAISNMSARNQKETKPENIHMLHKELQQIVSRRQILESIDPDGEHLNDLCKNDDLDEIKTNVIKIAKPFRGYARISTRITRLPSILCLHVKRLYFDPVRNVMAKTIQHVSFPEILDLGKICSTRSSKPINYRIMSVIEHRGNAYSGHYVTYRRITDYRNSLRHTTTQLKTWALISDEKVSFLSWHEVSRCQAYMLFYEAI